MTFKNVICFISAIFIVLLISSCATFSSKSLDDSKKSVEAVSTEECVYYQFDEGHFLDGKNVFVTAWEGPCIDSSKGVAPFSNGNEKNRYINDEEFFVKADSYGSLFFNEKIKTEIIIPHDLFSEESTIIVEGQEGVCFDEEHAVIVCMSHVPKRSQCTFFYINTEGGFGGNTEIHFSTWEADCVREGQIIRFNRPSRDLEDLEFDYIHNGHMMIFSNNELGVKIDNYKGKITLQDLNGKKKGWCFSEKLYFTCQLDE